MLSKDFHCRCWMLGLISDEHLAYFRHFDIFSCVVVEQHAFCHWYWQAITSIEQPSAWGLNLGPLLKSLQNIATYITILPEARNGIVRIHRVANLIFILLSTKCKGGFSLIYYSLCPVENRNPWPDGFWWKNMKLLNNSYVREISTALKWATGLLTPQLKR